MDRIGDQLRERSRRSSIAAMLSTDDDFSPEWGDDPDNLDPTNLPDDASTLAVYHRLVQAGKAQPVVSE